MDVVTKKSGHRMTGMAVSVCTAPAIPSAIPIPYPTKQYANPAGQRFTYSYDAQGKLWHVR